MLEQIEIEVSNNHRDVLDRDDAAKHALNERMEINPIVEAIKVVMVYKTIVLIPMIRLEQNLHHQVIEKHNLLPDITIDTEQKEGSSLAPSFRKAIETLYLQNR